MYLIIQENGPGGPTMDCQTNPRKETLDATLLLGLTLSMDGESDNCLFWDNARAEIIGRINCLT